MQFMSWESFVVAIYVKMVPVVPIPVVGWLLGCTTLPLLQISWPVACTGLSNPGVPAYWQCWLPDSCAAASANACVA
jgi:hypothetical protein